MADDARISTALPSHPKTRKLKRRLGAEGCWSLTCLILWAANNHSDGSLAGMTDEDIELACDWEGQPGAFVQALVEVRFLEGETNSHTIHDWSEHQAWVVSRSARIEKAKKAAAARWGIDARSRKRSKDGVEDVPKEVAQDTREDAPNVLSGAPSECSEHCSEQCSKGPSIDLAMPTTQPNLIPKVKVKTLRDTSTKNADAPPGNSPPTDNRNEALPAAARLAALLRDEILRNKPDTKITDKQLFNWSLTADRMIRLDKRSPECIAAVIRWAQADDFWMSNALSMKAIREKFDQLELKARASRGRRSSASVGTHQPMPPEPALEWRVPEVVDVETGAKLWNEAKEKIRQRVSRNSFDTWLNPTRALGLGQHALYVKLPAKEFAPDMGRFDAVLREVLPDQAITFVPPTRKTLEVSHAS